MPIPALDQHGFLPPGIHDCTLQELRTVFGGFAGTDRRSHLFSRLERFLGEARKSGVVAAVLVDGSFVTGRPDPNDIDLLIVVPSAHDFSADLNPADYNLLSKRRVHARFGFDILVAAEDSEQYHRYVRFFHQIRFEPERQKGILRLEL